MKTLFFLIILSFTISGIAQDGSNIRYINISELDNYYVGKMVHLGFFNRSFRGLKTNDKKLNNKIIIEFKNKKIEFSEHRFDDGYNNWFSEQYLESTEFIDNSKIRITMCKIKEIKLDSIKVILFVEYRDRFGKIKTKKSNKKEYEFPKKMLTEILVRN